MKTAIFMNPSCMSTTSVLALMFGTMTSTASASLLRSHHTVHHHRRTAESKTPMATSAEALKNSANDQNHRRLLGENDSCLATSNFDVNADECTLRAFLAAIETLLGSGCGSSREELALLLGVDLADLADAVGEICDAAESAETTSNALSFEDVLGEGYQFQKEFFDGNKWLNEDRETIDEHGVTDNVLAHEAYRILETYDDAAQKRVIKFPSDLPVFDQCEVSAAMCCWVQDRQADIDGDCDTEYDKNCVDADPTDNTDVCYVDMARAQQSNHVTAGFAIFDGGKDDEGNAYCHGFAWEDNEKADSYKYRGNALFHVSLYNNLFNKGYVRNVPGAPMCGCVDKMPIVTRADCTKVEVTADGVTLSFDKQYNVVTATLNHIVDYQDCNADKNLKSYFDGLTGVSGAIEETLVGAGNCPAAIGIFLGTQNLQRA